MAPNSHVSQSRIFFKFQTKINRFTHTTLHTHTHTHTLVDYKFELVNEKKLTKICLLVFFRSKTNSKVNTAPDGTDSLTDTAPTGAVHPFGLGGHPAPFQDGARRRRRHPLAAESLIRFFGRSNSHGIVGFFFCTIASFTIESMYRRGIRSEFN